MTQMRRVCDRNIFLSIRGLSLELSLEWASVLVCDVSRTPWAASGTGCSHVGSRSIRAAMQANVPPLGSEGSPR